MTEQLTLTLECSRAAASANEPNAATQRARILAFLRACGSVGATDQEMQTGCGLDGNTQRPRRWELDNRGLIYHTDAVRLTASRRRAVVWFAAEGGKHE